MNRYPLWKYIVIAVALLLGASTPLPNFFGEAPAVQVSRATADGQGRRRAAGARRDALKAAGVADDGATLDGD
ncbi:MAG: hypothetical protein MZW92_35380 [Comamonadaceae bacterium]|nr:hypothetical protein [Comamonadaceae bacterium]